MSAVFSPSVSLPFSFTSSTAVKPEYSSATHAARSSNALRVGRRPPVAQVALRVELAPLIVEAVRQLVADDRAGAAVVHRGVAPSRCRTAAAGCRRGS